MSFHLHMKSSLLVPCHLSVFPQVQLQLLTAIVKLFLKKPTETQELVQQVLSLATQVSAPASLLRPVQVSLHRGRCGLRSQPDLGAKVLPLRLASLEGLALE